MPTIQEILTQVQDQYPNSFSDAKLLIWGNEILRKIWKFMNEDDIYQFSLIENQTIYSLPSDGLSLDKISVIEIAKDDSLNDWTSHYYKGLLNENLVSNFFYDAYNGNFGIYPPPGKNITDGGKIFYGPKFEIMTTDDLTVVPRVNEDYHSIIVNYICMKCAGAGNNPDTESRNNFASDFNDDWQRLMSDNVRKKCKAPKKDRKNKWW